ncbi:MAG TPA: FkbM family methyltransferase [Humisphaera sp.]|jgi:FkbM family methyltransferase|nr:FkbM family methyltransferase [Humisphaera sp.]
MSLIRTIVRRLPPGWVRAAGQLQFRYPILAPLIRRAGAGFSRGESVMRHGVGKGLRFDPAGGNPGYALGTSDIEEQEALARLLKPGDVFYDIGANVGFFAIIAARLVGPSGHVHAFEPFAGSAGAIRDNAARNGFVNVNVHECAVSDKEGQGELLVERGGTEFKLVDGAAPAPGKKISVRIVQIDALLAAGTLPPPRVVMIDAEGAEVNVLKGMWQTLAQHRPIVLCEVHWLGAAFTEICDRASQELGYQTRPLAGGEIPQGPIRWHAIMEPR